MYSVPPGYRRTAPVKRLKLDGFTEIIDAWLLEDADRPRKQRHTAKRVLDRLRDEHGFTGGYTIVKAYLREHQRRSRKMFVPLHHAPGHAQADFGEALVVIGGVEQKAHFFVFDLPHSDACYVRAYPAATAEAWADGHVHAFAFFGRVPLSVLNIWLEEQCRKRQSEILRGHQETIGERLQRDLAAMMPLPPAPFEACDQATGRVSSQALVRYRSSSVKKSIQWIDFSEERLLGAGQLRPPRGLDQGLRRRSRHRLRRRR